MIFRNLTYTYFCHGGNLCGALSRVPLRWWEFWVPKLLIAWLQKIEQVTFKSLRLFIFWFDSLLNSTAFCSQTRCGGSSLCWPVKWKKKWVAILTHFAPDCLSLPALFPYCMTPYCPVVANQQMLHTGIPAYANRNRILARLVALFLLLFTTSGDMFFEVWWKLRDGHMIDAQK